MAELKIHISHSKCLVSSLGSGFENDIQVREAELNRFYVHGLGLHIRERKTLGLRSEGTRVSPEARTPRRLAVK